MLFLVAFLLILTSVFSYEAQLSSLGFETIDINQSQKKECQLVSFNLSDINETGNVILSLQAKFEAIKSDSSYVSLQVNDNAPQIIWPEFFSCEKTCWARIFLPEVRSKKTDLTLCISTGGLINSAELSNSSFIGIYQTPVLSIKTNAPQSIILGERAKMSIQITNSGTKKAELFSQFVSQDIRSLIDITSFDIVEGESSVTTEVNPGESKEFFYYIKPNKTGTYNLPYAILNFDNVFAEKQIIVSNHTQLKVLTPEQVSVSIVSVPISKNSLKITAIVKNNWNKRFEGSIYFKPTDIVTSQVKELSLEPESEREITAYTMQLLPGQYNFSALIVDTADNNNQYYSNSIEYPVIKEDIPFSIIFAVFGVIAAVAVFIGIYYLRDKKRK